MELTPLLESMRVDGILYASHRNVGHDYHTQNLDGNGLVLSPLLNMDKNLSFVDFSGLPPHERDNVQQILHGPNSEPGHKKIDLPWLKTKPGDDSMPYEAYNGNPPPPPPSIIPIATMYAGQVGQVPPIPQVAPIFQPPMVPMVFTPPPVAPVVAPVVGPPPPGMIPMSMVNPEFIAAPPHLPDPSVVAAVVNHDVVTAHRPASKHVTFQEPEPVDLSQPTVILDTLEASKTCDGGMQQEALIEPGSTALLKDTSGAGGGNVGADLANGGVAGVAVTMTKGVEKEEVVMTMVSPDCDNVISGKLEKTRFDKEAAEAEMVKEISFFDSEISGNGDLPSDNLQLTRHNDQYVVSFAKQKTAANNSACSSRSKGHSPDTTATSAKTNPKPTNTNNLPPPSLPLSSTTTAAGVVQSDGAEREEGNVRMKSRPNTNANDQQKSSPRQSRSEESRAANSPIAVNGSSGDSKEAKTSTTTKNNNNKARPVSNEKSLAGAVSGEKVCNSLEPESQTPTVGVAKDADSISSAESVEPAASPVGDRNVSSPTPQLPKTKSWAGLFRNTEATSKSIIVYSGSSHGGDAATAASKRTSSPASGDRGVTLTAVANASPDREFSKESSPQLSSPVAVIDDRMAIKLGTALKNTSLVYRPVSLQPRALNNKGNWCYINATLQALLSCPPFYHLIKNLPLVSIKQRGPSSTPVLDAMFQFVSEFSAMPHTASKKRPPSTELIPGPPFEPLCMYNMLNMIESTLSFKFGKQEDAEEFLSFVLNKLHDEMLAVVNVASGGSTPADEDSNSNHKENGVLPDENANNTTGDDWEQVGPKNKTVFTRRAYFSRSCVSDIFAGQMRSAVYQVASKESATLQPFFTLQLDIQSDKVWSVTDALEGLASKEAVHGYTCSKTNTEVEITKKVTLEELPPVLILHFKCFIYDKNGGIQKVMKKIDYPVELDISKELLSPARSRIPQSQRSYKLFAVIFHHGKNATGGHYTAGVYHTGINSWILYDDGQVKQVALTHVLKSALNRIPYLLFYRRCDLS